MCVCAVVWYTRERKREGAIGCETRCAYASAKGKWNEINKLSKKKNKIKPYVCVCDQLRGFASSWCEARGPVCVCTLCVRPDRRRRRHCRSVALRARSVGSTAVGQRAASRSTVRAVQLAECERPWPAGANQRTRYWTRSRVVCKGRLGTENSAGNAGRPRRRPTVNVFPSHSSSNNNKTSDFQLKNLVSFFGPFHKRRWSLVFLEKSRWWKLRETVDHGLPAKNCTTRFEIFLIFFIDMHFRWFVRVVSFFFSAVGLDSHRVDLILQWRLEFRKD